MNELTRYGAKAITRNPDSVSKEAGSRLMLVGSGGLVIGAVAWLVPFVTLPMLLIVAVLMGGYLYTK